MAARSYLSRIAQPLTAADPVVWSTPRAAVDETRPASSRAAAAPLLSPHASPRPAAAPPAASAMPDRASAAAPPTAETPSPPPSLPAPDRPGAIEATIAAARVEPITVSPRRSGIAPFATVERIDDLEPPPAVAPMMRDLETVDHDAAAVPSAAPAASRTIEDIAAYGTAETAAFASPPQAEGRRRALEASEDVVPPNASVAPPRSGPAAAAENATILQTPRLHIGAIEIRLAQPPVPPPHQPQVPAPAVMSAPPAAATPLARGYASRFGLAQG